MAKGVIHRRRAVAARNYEILMTEVKARIDAMVAINDSTCKSSLHPDFRNEFSFLQLRMICEVIALACLMAHGDIAEARSKKELMKEWSSERIMRALETLHDRFYPEPTGPPMDATGTISDPDRMEILFVSKPTDDYLTKDELLKLVPRCGEFVHRGSFRRLFRRPPEVDPHEIQQWITKIGSLLKCHQIQLVIPDTWLWVAMAHGPDQRVRVWQLDAAPTSRV